MFEKKYKINYDSLKIIFIETKNIEKITRKFYINGELIIQDEINMKLYKYFFTKKIQDFKYNIEYKGKRINIIGGIAWYIFGNGIEVYIDGNPIGGVKIISNKKLNFQIILMLSLVGLKFIIAYFYIKWVKMIPIFILFFLYNYLKSRKFQNNIKKYNIKKI